MYKSSKYNIFTQLVDQASGEPFALAYNTRKGKFLRLAARTHASLQAGELHQLPSSEVTSLFENGFVVASDADELKEVLNENRRSALKPNLLYMVLQPSAYCQFGCHYCGQSHVKKTMAPCDVEKLIMRIDEQIKKHGYKHLYIGWFGSEPLTGLAKIRIISEKLIALTKEHGITYAAKMVTNGHLLSADVAKELYETYKVESFEVTLDGTAEEHDKRRHTKARTGTFSQIFANIKAICDADFGVKIVIRSNVDPRNKASISDLLQLIADSGFAKKIAYYVAPIHSWGNDAHLLSAKAQEFAMWEIEWFLQMKELGFRSNTYFPKRLPVPCMALNPHAHLVDPYGKVFGCTEVSLTNAYNDKDGHNTYDLGHVADKPLDASADKRPFLKFNDKVEAKGVPCSNCPMLPICGGRCPKQWLDGHIPCPSFKYNFKERMLLKYLEQKKKKVEALA